MPRHELLDRRWRLEPAPDELTATALATGLPVPLPFARLLAQRGCRTPEEARRFLRPARRDLHDPALLPDVATAVERLARAVARREPVFLHGDYDVDGQCSAAIMTRVIRRAGGVAVPFVPHRLRDGYDLSDAGVRAAAAAGAGVLVTLDCGTTALGPVRDARRAGMDVIVVDHHLPGAELPDAVALVNPRRADSAYPFPDLCGAGLAWQLARALAAATGVPEGYVWHLLDLAAMATIADLVPLVGENRVIARLGLKVMQATRWTGLRALLAEANLAGKVPKAGQIGFIVAPRLNAAGRIGDAMDGLTLLLTDDEAQAARLAAQLSRQNVERQAIDQRTLEEALDDLERDFDPARDIGVVLAREGWHPGVIGIVASRVVERIARPTFLVALDPALGKGSGRSAGRCNLHRALQDCAPLLEKWGGHRMAAGLTVRRDRLDEFRAAFNRACTAQVGGDELVPTQRVDAVLALGDLTLEFERLVRALEPTGMGNPGPVFGLQGVTLAGALKLIGEEHCRFTLTDGTSRLRTVSWGGREEVTRLLGPSPAEGRWRVAVKLERDDWQGVEQVEGRLVGLAADG
jgi:single-stranded-DNA-specific exonuclease